MALDILTGTRVKHMELSQIIYTEIEKTETSILKNFLCAFVMSMFQLHA
jgi:hypothetical protein